MKKLPLTLILLFPVVLFSQEHIKPEDIVTYSKFSIGANMSNDACFRTLDNRDGEGTGDVIINARNDREKPRWGYSTGVNALYQFSQHWGVEGGAQYSNRGYSFTTDVMVYGGFVDPRRGFLYDGSGDPVSKVKFLYNYHYLDILLKLVYTAGKGRARFISGIGITTGIFLNSTQTQIVYYGDGDTERNNYKEEGDFKALNLSPTVSVGVDYQLAKRINLRLEPTFRYGVLSTTDTPVVEYLWSGGLNFSCYYSFK